MRPALPNPGQEKHITFQHIEVRENNQPSGRSEIHLFGVTKASHSILVRVLGFEHYFYYPAPQGISEDDLGCLKEYINECLVEIAISEIELESQSVSRAREPLLFLKIYLFDHRQMRRYKHFLTSGACEYRNIFSSPELSYETTVPYFLRFMLDNGITPMSWIQIPAKRYTRIASERAVSFCQLEVTVPFESLLKCKPVENSEKSAPFRILSFDLECNVRPDGQFSNAQDQEVVQIGNMVSTYGSEEEPFSRTIFTLGSCSAISGSQVFSFEDESKMLMAWKKFFIEVDPDIVTGYNITQFDIPYLLNRARALMLRDFPFLGRIKASPQRLVLRQPNFLECPGYDGRLLLDVYHHIRENHPGLEGQGAYKLSAVSEHFLKDRKEDIHYTEIPRLQSESADTRRQLAVYCLKDVYLPLRLMKKLKCFEREVNEAKDAHVPYNALRVSRSLKVIARRYRDAMDRECILVDAQ
ncbi:hypothetical protein HYPSUDRAFT_166097 [Hypholoma sublateritium FD-334 SS-4]|uniref:DNA polymerase delta catalytic subunit n=1 Tax=Hypholoma sublateritium (strain FD-334 SS-4) TaxID=945553 RepID=A0A0D2PN08_HYPSF|nr:hypothetical protein HYPSUDRAFT_166097 [Hypholoma sublateritium FD-334 SS-4]